MKGRRRGQTDKGDELQPHERTSKRRRMMARHVQDPPPYNTQVDRTQGSDLEDGGNSADGNLDYGPSEEIPMTIPSADQDGLADIARKILRPPLSGQTTVLLKDKGVERKMAAARATARAKHDAAVERKARRELGHVIPDVTTKNYERSLAKIGTRGVVRLFNTVRKKQRELDERLDDVPAGKKEKVAAAVLSKSNFLGLLKGPQSGVRAATAGLQRSCDSKTAWLSSQFMMGARMKDWDRDVDVGDDGDSDADRSSNGERSS